MSERRRHADQLGSALRLGRQPIAVAFPDGLPDDVPLFEGTVPAGCSFWERAERGTFATTARDHELCSIGIHTHNLAGAPAAQQEELQAALETMTGLDYVRAEEVAAIPVRNRAASHVLYGPLRDFPIDAEVVLLFADAAQGLVLSEAVERVDRGLAPVMGRPACAVIPQVLQHRRATLSLGCCGARAYLDSLEDGVALWALPGEKLASYCTEIEILARANATLSVFHEQRRHDVEAGERPTVRESLQRLPNS